MAQDDAVGTHRVDPAQKGTLRDHVRKHGDEMREYQETGMRFVRNPRGVHGARVVTGDVMHDFGWAEMAVRNHRIVQNADELRRQRFVDEDIGSTRRSCEIVDWSGVATDYNAAACKVE